MAGRDPHCHSLYPLMGHPAFQALPQVLLVHPPHPAQMGLLQLLEGAQTDVDFFSFGEFAIAFMYALFVRTNSNHHQRTEIYITVAE